jgi:hypothetical protein
MDETGEAYRIAAPGNMPAEDGTTTDRLIVTSRERFTMHHGKPVLVRGVKRIAGRIAGFDHKVVAGSPDGTTIYYAEPGSIWAMPSAARTIRSERRCR